MTFRITQKEESHLLFMLFLSSFCEGIKQESTKFEKEISVEIKQTME